MKILAVCVALCSFLLFASRASAAETTHEKCSSDSLKLWFASRWVPGSEKNFPGGPIEQLESVVLAKGESAVVPGFIENSYGGGSPFANVGDGGRYTYELAGGIQGGSWLPWSCGGPSHDITRCGFGVEAWRVTRSTSGREFTVECAYHGEAESAFGYSGTKVMKPATKAAPQPPPTDTPPTTPPPANVAHLPNAAKALAPAVKSVSGTGLTKGRDRIEVVTLTVETANFPAAARFALVRVAGRDEKSAVLPAPTRAGDTLTFSVPWNALVGLDPTFAKPYPGGRYRVTGLFLDTSGVTSRFLVHPISLCGEGGCITFVLPAKPTALPPVPAVIAH